MLRFQNITIVIVEDNSDVRLLIADFLAKNGAVVFAAKNGLEGFALVRKNRPDVVLSDINLPGRNGFELLADIRALGRHGGGNVPVIAMTAFGRALGREATLAAGFQAHLDKPFSPDQLLMTIDSVLNS